IPDALKTLYESLLNDPSYITREAALYNLWINFPSDRHRYLDSTKGSMGLNDRNLRILWLILHLNTPDYEQEIKPKVFDELLAYTAEHYNISVRIRAFSYLLQMELCKGDCLSNLKASAGHHNWQMAKFAREQLEIIGEQ
ncbi:MAG: M1 family peptidase, partial [Bacteroidia bacterium]|nr:M1 family peptidase [Bacteroidia bacterium]